MYSIVFKISFLTFFLHLIFCSFIATAQDEKFNHFNAGVGVININYEGFQYLALDTSTITKPISGSYTPLTAYFDFNFPVFNIKEISSVGINPGATMSVGSDLLGFSIPVFINYKLGADAQIHSYGTKLGFTTGIGYQVSAYHFENFEYIGTQPVFMAEFDIRNHYHMVHKFRIMGTFTGFDTSVKTISGEQNGSDVRIKSYLGVFYLINI